MQTNNMVLKRKVLFDNQEYKGLVAVGQKIDQKGTVEIGGFDRKVDVPDGIRKVEPITLTFKVDRDAETYTYVKSWFYNDERHDLTIINTDGHGNEYDRDIWPACELTILDDGEYDSTSPSAFQFTITLVTQDEPIRLEA